MENIEKKPVIYWNKTVPDTNLEKFKRSVEEKYSLKFESYWDFQKWTVKKYPNFLEELWHFFGIISSEPYTEIFMKTGPGFLDNKWFVGAKLNYAENLLRIRDDRIALICIDELDTKQIVTYKEMFEEVKQYAAAFKKNGLKAGDRVACCLPNIKESVFTLLAVASVGAIFVGILPYCGDKMVSRMVNMVDAKFLVVVDRHQDSGIVFETTDHLEDILYNAPKIEKTIMVVTQEETSRTKVQNVHKCVSYKDFLEEGCAPDGKVPDIIFEQLPFDHPLCINFTSGTTGFPKPLVHSIGTLLSLMRDISITYNIKPGEIVSRQTPVGWSLWDSFLPCLSFGITLVLYCGHNCYIINGKNYWDHLAKYHCSTSFIVTSLADRMEKSQIVPSPGSDMSYLKRVFIVGSPVKNHNFEYFKTKVKKDMFVGIRYGTTELFGSLSGTDLNIPVYGGEVQVPPLGLDIQCFDSEGNSVVGQMGEVVICSPAINFPIGFWNDDDKTTIADIYLSKFPGVWTQHDGCWINPETKGMVIIGRSDETLKQRDERFGAADIYFAVHSLDELQDYICVGQQKRDGISRAVLFVQMRDGLKMTPEIKAKIQKKVSDELWEGCIPELILQVPSIPYNFNNKRLEGAVKKILETNKIPEVNNIQNPDSLKYFVNIPEVLSYNQL